MAQVDSGWLSTSCVFNMLFPCSFERSRKCGGTLFHVCSDIEGSESTGQQCTEVTSMWVAPRFHPRMPDPQGLQESRKIGKCCVEDHYSPWAADNRPFVRKVQPSARGARMDSFSELKK